MLIRAMARVGRDALLVLAGDGPGVDDCRALAASLGLGNHVRFLGLRDDVERIYAAADVMVMPSLWDEAFGLVVVEAMAAGRPVVRHALGRDAGARRRGRGVMVPKRDEVAMAGAIGRLLDDDSLRARIGQAARAHAIERFGMPAWIERIMGEYAALVPALAPASEGGVIARLQALFMKRPRRVEPARRRDGSSRPRSRSRCRSCWRACSRPSSSARTNNSSSSPRRCSSPGSSA